jgi:putative flippase GtrA
MNQFVQKVVRYTAASLATTVVAQGIILGGTMAYPGWSPVIISAIATVIAVIPSFEVHRRWVWQRHGPSRVTAEVIPFVAIAVVGLIVSSALVGVAGALTHSLSPHHLEHSLVLDGAYLSGYAFIWVARFFLLDGVVFAKRT